MKIIGIDPGSQITGYGIIETEGSFLNLIDLGTIKPPQKLSLGEKYLILYESTRFLIEKYQPSALSVENQFVYKNVQATLTLGMAKGAILIAAASLKIPVFEYAPTEAKKSLTGNGFASKHQIQHMLQRLFRLDTLPPADAADAIMLAICHFNKAPS